MNIAHLNPERDSQALNDSAAVSMLHDVSLMLTERLASMIGVTQFAPSPQVTLTYSPQAGLQASVDLRGRDAVVAAELALRGEPLKALGFSIGNVRRSQTPGSSFTTRLTAALS